METITQQLKKTLLGQFLHRRLRPAVVFARRVAHPKLPPDHRIAVVSYGKSKFTFEHRRGSPSDRMAIEQCFGDAQYDLPGGEHGKELDRIYREIVSGGRKPLIIDCGANIGASVVWFSCRYPEAHIVAVEPAPDNCELLRKNTDGCDVDVRQAGIAATDGTAFLFDAYGGVDFKAAQMGYQVKMEGSGKPVPTFSIATLLASKPESLYAPFLLKIDIEGGEKSLFSGDVAAIDRFPLIILEPHDWREPGQLISREFFRFHVEARREFVIKHENVASIALSR